jgi:hypothetical protein
LAFEQIPRREDDAEALRASLRSGAPPAGFGDADLLPDRMAASSGALLDGALGEGFVAAVAALPESIWAGPRSKADIAAIWSAWKVSRCRCSRRLTEPGRPSRGIGSRQSARATGTKGSVSEETAATRQV